MALRCRGSVTERPISAVVRVHRTAAICALGWELRKGREANAFKHGMGTAEVAEERKTLNALLGECREAL